MTDIWDLREAFDLYPNESGFTCSGITQRGARCRQSFIARVDKEEAIQLLDSLPEHDGFFTNPQTLYSSLQQLAELTLCPRWHRHGRLSQINTVALKWLRTIQSLNTMGSTRRPVHQTRAGLANNHLPAPVPIRALLAAQATYRQSQSTPITTVSSRSTSSGSRILPALLTPPRTPFRSPTSLPDTGVNTPALHNSSTGQITVSVTVSSSNGGGSTSTTIVQQLPSDSPPSSTTISISTATPQTVINISNTPHRNHEIVPISNTSSSMRARSRVPSIPRELSPAVTSTYAGLHSSGQLSEMVSRTPSTSRISTLLVSPPPSPLSSHSVGTRSISTEAGIYTPTSSVAISDYAPSPPETPTFSSTQISRSPSPSPAPLTPDPTTSVSSLARQGPTRVTRRSISDPCYVCFLGIETQADAVWCQDSCGQNAHNECFEEWFETCNAVGRPVTCMFCRVPWVS